LKKNHRSWQQCRPDAYSGEAADKFFLDWGTSHWIANDCRTVHLCSIILTAELRALVCENCFQLITVVDVVVIVVAKIIYTSVAVGCSVSLMKINVNIR